MNIAGGSIYNGGNQGQSVDLTPLQNKTQNINALLTTANLTSFDEPIEIKTNQPFDNQFAFHDTSQTREQPAVGFIQGNGTNGPKYSFGGLGDLNEVSLITYTANDNILLKTTANPTIKINTNGTLQLERPGVYTGTTDAIIKLNTNGTLEKSTGATCTTTGDLKINSVNTNSYKNKTFGIGFDIEDTTAGQVIYNSPSLYADGNPNRVLIMDGTGKLNKSGATIDAIGNLSASNTTLASLELKNNLSFDLNNSHDLGTSAFRARNVWYSTKLYGNIADFTGDINTSNILPLTDNTSDIGSSANSYKDIYFKGKFYKNGISYSFPIVENRLWAGSFQQQGTRYLEAGAGSGTSSQNVSNQWAPYKNIRITGFIVRKENATPQTDFILYKSDLNFATFTDLQTVTINAGQTTASNTALNININFLETLWVRTSSSGSGNPRMVQAYVLFNTP